MCTGKCAKFIGISLYPLAALSIICNIVLFFPDMKTNYAADDKEGEPRLTNEVKYMCGVIGGGLLVLIPAIHIHSTGSKGCCANRCGMFLSILFAAVGLVGALYCAAVSAVALVKGPVCKTPDGLWGRPFDHNGTDNYLGNKDVWKLCVEPKNVVEFNIGLFATLLVVGLIELLLCGFQVFNGLFGCLCGTCNNKEAE